ncbi:hypothetical protein L1887_58474 [Cichorium endivia]|nr:hypothetical protein L1887_58474 [Cichorium endivia]
MAPWSQDEVAACARWKAVVACDASERVPSIVTAGASNLGSRVDAAAALFMIIQSFASRLPSSTPSTPSARRLCLHPFPLPFTTPIPLSSTLDSEALDSPTHRAFISTLAMTT